MRLALVVATLTLALAAPLRAALPADGWPQTRRDEALTARSDEPALPSARLKWVALTGGELSGEPAVHGCTVVVTDGGGKVHAFNARNGAPLWTHERDWAVQPAGVPSALAIDDAGVVNVGLPADPLLERALRAVIAIFIAMESYAIDNNEYPPGPDLAAALTPTYMRSLPPNPATGAPMVESDTWSLGDYRYERVTGGEFHLGIWGSDGGILDVLRECATGAFGGPGPGWPLSAERGGTPTRLDEATGALVSRDLGEGIASTLTPSVSGSAVDWTSQEDRRSLGFWYWWWWGGWNGTADDGYRVGALRRTSGGARSWSDVRWGGTRGAAAHDASGNAFVSHVASRVAAAAMNAARTIATAVESYSIDNSAYPASGDLEAVLTPTYIRCLPPSLMHDGPMTGAPFAAGGDYEYVLLDTFAYTITLWDDDGGVLTVFDTGAFTQVAEDRPPLVVSLAPDGTPRWRTRVGLPTQDVTPVALGGGSVIVGTTGGELYALDAADGSERWRVDAGEPLSLAPALLPDGGPVLVTGSGTVVAHAPDGSERWRRWMGSTITAAPATTADGVTYVADLDGTLRALSPADGATIWSTYLGGVDRAGLTTTPVQSEGWLYVGRSDGALLALVPRETAGRPQDPAPLMAAGRATTTSVGWTWAAAPWPSDPGAHWHLHRWAGSLLDAPDELLAPHPSAATGFVDASAAGSLLFYSVVAADCGENVSGP